MLNDVRRTKKVLDADKSGKFVVRIPRTLHAVLDLEAQRERVSLNQLAAVKLSRPVSSKDVRIANIVEAFRQIHDGYSADRVIVDPDLNAQFLNRCRDLGIVDGTDYDINHALYDIRKSGKAEFPPTTKQTVFRDMDLYSFASEIAIRSLQRALWG